MISQPNFENVCNEYKLSNSVPNEVRRMVPHPSRLTRSIDAQVLVGIT